MAGVSRCFETTPGASSHNGSTSGRSREAISPTGSQDRRAQGPAYDGVGTNKSNSSNQVLWQWRCSANSRAKTSAHHNSCPVLVPKHGVAQRSVMDAHGKSDGEHPVAAVAPPVRAAFLTPQLLPTDRAPGRRPPVPGHAGVWTPRASATRRHSWASVPGHPLRAADRLSRTLSTRQCAALTAPGYQSPGATRAARTVARSIESPCTWAPLGLTPSLAQLRCRAKPDCKCDASL